MKLKWKEVLMEEPVRIPKSVTLCSDGKYRWVYELPMMKNPVILITVYKVLLIGACFPFLIVLILSGFQDAFKILKVFFIVLLILFVTGLISYMILAALYGWHYCVIFEMDEKGILHTQQPKQFKKAQALGVTASLAGTAAGNPSAAGTGLLAATKNSQYSEFDKVKKVKCFPKLNLIKLDYPFSHNQIYAADDAFEFVAEYIRSKCKGAKQS